MLETASFMMTELDWPYRGTTISLRSQGDEEGSFGSSAQTYPDSIGQVFGRELDISIMNPA